MAWRSSTYWSNGDPMIDPPEGLRQPDQLQDEQRVALGAFGDGAQQRLVRRSPQLAGGQLRHLRRRKAADGHVARRAPPPDLGQDLRETGVRVRLAGAVHAH
jgi:hypothetical protein